MAEIFPIEKKLKLAVQKRIKKLKKLRRRTRMWGIAGMICAITACAPLLYFLLTDNIPAVSFEKTIYISSDCAVIVGCLGVGWLGAMLFYGQYKRDKDKYDNIRAGAVDLLRAGDPVCECKWTPCTCKDDLLKHLSEQYDINVSY